MSFLTPVVFIIYNRADLTEKVFQRISQVQPKKLFVIADGPRTFQDVEKCHNARAVIEKVDWDCDVFTDFSDTNLGCGQRIASGLNWVFSQVDEAIILEDDCLPTPSFFNYCHILLNHYRYDDRIMHINGDNSLMQSRNKYSYFFSKYMHCWGWASWRRSWQHFDYYIKSWDEFKRSGMFQLACDSSYEQKFWADIWNQIYENPNAIDSWAYRWMYACLAQGGLTITPNQNLISNIGHDRIDATHTVSNNPRSNLPTIDIWEIHHPPFIVRDQEADAQIFDEVFNGKQLKAMDTPIGKLKQTLSPIKKKFLSF